MPLKRINFHELGLPVGPYTHAAIHERTLYTSGLTAFGTDAQSSAIDQQARAIFAQLEIIALRQHSSLENLIKVTIYVTDLADITTLRDTLFDLYGDHIPASSLIKIESLFSSELKIEIEAIFAL